MSIASGETMFKRSALAAGAAALALGLAACGSSSSTPSSTNATQAPVKEASPPGDIPDNQAYVPYTPPGANYSIKVPEGWARTGAGGAVVFTDKLNSIRLQSEAAARPPELAGYKAAQVAALGRTVPGFQFGKASAISRPAGPVILITYLAQGAADPVTGKTRQTAVERYAYFHGGKLVTVTLTGAKGADNVDPWKTVTSSLRWQA
jgi:hypothetical protein